MINAKAEPVCCQKAKIFRGSIHDNAQIKSSSTLSLLLGFVFMATQAARLPRNAFGNCILRSVVGYVEIST